VTTEAEIIRLKNLAEWYEQQMDEITAKLVKIRMELAMSSAENKPDKIMARQVTTEVPHGL